MSLRRAHSLALRAEFQTDQARRAGSERELRRARQLHAQASIEFEKSGDARQARYHARKAKELYYEIHRHDPAPGDPYLPFLVTTDENPLNAEDWFRIAVGIIAIGAVGFSFWMKAQENALSLATPPVTPPVNPPAGGGFTTAGFTATATDINPGPVPIPPPPTTPVAGGTPLPVPPSA